MLDFHDTIACEDIVHILPWFLIFGFCLASVLSFTTIVCSRAITAKRED